MGQKMGLISVTTMQGVSVTPHSPFFLDWAMHTTGGMGKSFVATQIASYLAHSEAKRCTITVSHTEFTAGQYSYIIIMVPRSPLWQGMRREHIALLNPITHPT